MDVPAGWYPDPASSTSARWWDGSAWTDHTTPLAELLGTAAAPAYAAPESDTLVLPGSAASPDVVPPFVPVDPATTDTAVYPLGPVYDESGFPAAPTPRRSVGWGVIAVVGVVALALVAGAVLAVRALGPGTDRPAASRPTTGTPTTPTPSGSTSTGAGSSAAGSATAVEAGRVLETFKPSTATLPAGVEASLVPQGDRVAGQKTLDGWCSSSYASEKDRIARRQWELTQNGQAIGLSVEAVAYATPEQAAAALAEFRRTTDACHAVTVDEDGTPVTQDVVSAGGMTGLPQGVTGYRATATVAGTGTDGTPFRGTSTSTLQRKGQYVTIVWTNQSTAISAGDRRVIDQFVAEQTRALAATS